MPRFAANLSTMFQEVPFLDRFKAAAEAGFRGVEFLFPYEHPPEAVEERLRTCGLENVMFNTPAGDWAHGERGTACIPSRVEEFRAGVDKALVYAARLGPPRLHAVAGIGPKDVDPALCRATLIENLKYAAAKLAARNLILMLEAINTRDAPGFFIPTQAECYSICAAVGAPNMKMQMDIYHMQVQEGDVATKLRRYAPHCAHVQAAGVPERHEPDTGELRYEYIFRLLDELKYQGWVGLEYLPAHRTVDGLGWFKRERA